MLSRGFGSASSTGYINTSSLISSSSGTKNNVAANLLSTDGNAVMTGSFKTSNLTIGDGSTGDLVINGINLGSYAQETANLTVEGTFNTVIQTWDYNTSSVFGKTSRLLRTYHDDSGIKYALIKTTYNWNLNFASSLIGYDTNNRSDAEMNVLSMMNTAVSQNLYYKDIYEIVIVGFTFREKNKRIAIPNFVQVPYFMDNIMPETEKYDGYYPVREIWGCHIYATTTQNSSVHLLSAEELSNPDEVLNVPTSISAPYIRKITLKHKIDNNLWFFSCVGPKIFDFPLLQKIVGLSDMYKAPVLCGLNMAGRSIENIAFPALKEIKNCLFGCVNNSLSFIELPELERLVECTFFCSCPELVELDLPLVNYIRGCDFFLAQCANLEVLRLNANITFLPHECMPTLPEGQRANIHDANYFLEVLNAVMVVIGLTPQFSAYRRFGGSNSMSFFLKDSPKLAQYKMVSKGQYETYDVKRDNGIRLHYSNIGCLPCYLTNVNTAEGTLVETYSQYITRVNRENHGAEGWVDLTMEDKNVNGTPIYLYGTKTLNAKSYYYIEPVANVILFTPEGPSGADGSVTLADCAVVPIDPRTAFMADSSDASWWGSDLDDPTSKAWRVAIPSVCNIIDVPASLQANAKLTNLATVINNWFAICFGWRNSIGFDQVDKNGESIVPNKPDDTNYLPVKPTYNPSS